MNDAPHDPRTDYDRYLISTPSAESISAREIDYRDLTPKPFTVQIPFWEYFERVKRFKILRWQRSLADTLQEAAVNRHVERWLGIIHCEGQGGKTSMISHCFPAWLIGHNPLFRFALAMYNATRSQNHSQQVIEIMNSNLHKDIFPDKDGWLRTTSAGFGRGEGVAKSGWYTNARWEVGDAQFSFNPVGLLSGLTGSGFDWLGIDDPYKEAKEAFSPLINDAMHNFWEYTVVSRLELHSCVSGMFHRYAPDDFGGYLLDKGNFEYLRYASQADGDYIHPNTGQRFPDPLDRQQGEYLMPERRPAKYYDEAKKNKRVWLSMYQGKPSDEEGEMFSVGKINIVDGIEARDLCSQVVMWGRGYDLAATDEAGAYTVGWHGGMAPDGKIVFDKMYRKRVDTATRQAAMKSNALEDGSACLIAIPKDPGAAGTSVIAYAEVDLQGYTVVPRATTDNKVQRALNFSIATNSGKVYFVKAHPPEPEFECLKCHLTIPVDTCPSCSEKCVDMNADWVDWNHQAKKEMREFPLSDYKDIVDAGSDLYNTLFEAVRRGLVVKNYKPQRNIVCRDEFWKRFPAYSNAEKTLPTFRIPEKWQIYAAVKIASDSARATSAVICARASVNSNLPEDLFVIDEYKEYDTNIYALFEWLEKKIGDLTAKSAEKDVTIWLHPDSEQYYQTIAQKLPFRVAMFTDDELAGHNELNWYLMPTEKSHPFGATEEAAHLYFLVERGNLSEAVAGQPYGFYHARQELATWGFDDKGNPTKVGDVLDCLRMITHRFKTVAQDVTLKEEIEIKMKEYFPHEIAAGTFTAERQQELEAARYLTEMAMEEKHGEAVFEDLDDDDFLYFSR